MDVTFEISRILINGVMYCILNTTNEEFKSLNKQCHYTNLLKAMDYISNEIKIQGFRCCFIIV
jgi:hypothetical protein